MVNFNKKIKNKERKNWPLIVFMIIILMGTSFSFVFFGFAPPSDKIKYKGISFTHNPNQGIWIAKINGKYAAFSFLPKDVENISVNAKIPSLQAGTYEIDVTYDFNDTYKQAMALAQHQMALTLEQYGIYVRKGFTTNNTYNLPIINCDEATQVVPVVYFRSGNSTSTTIYSEGNCIIAEASKNQDFLKLKDRLLYGTMGLI